jgi:hypothetical protein
MTSIVVSFTVITVGAIVVGTGWYAIGLGLIAAGFAFAVVASTRWRRQARARVGDPPWNVEFPAWTRSTTKIWLVAIAAGAAALAVVLVVAGITRL